MKKLKSLKLMLLGLFAMGSTSAFADVVVIENGALQGGHTTTTAEYTPSPYALKYTIKNLTFTDGYASVKKAEVEVSQGSAFSASTATVAPENTIAPRRADRRSSSRSTPS